MRPLAHDIILILESCNQKVDPFLRQLLLQPNEEDVDEEEVEEVDEEEEIQEMDM
jgi:hypothetical protein